MRRGTAAIPGDHSRAESIVRGRAGEEKVIVRSRFIASGSVCAISFMSAGHVAAQSPIVSPAKGQSTGQHSRDEGECQSWAKKNTGIDAGGPGVA
jgi:hypothetical protein